MQMAEPGVPYPGFFLSARRQAHRLCYVDVEHIQASWAAVDLGQQPALLVAHSHDPTLNQHLVVGLVQLTDGDNIRGEAGKVVDIVDGAMLPRLAGEKDGADSLDARYGAVAEPHGTSDAGVDVGERGPCPRHVVRCARVQDPSPGIPVAGFVEDGEHLALCEMELAVGADRWWSRRSWLRRRQLLDLGENPLPLLTVHRKEQSGLVILGHVGLLQLLLAPAIFGPVAFLATGLAGTIADALG